MDILVVGEGARLVKLVDRKTALSSRIVPERYGTSSGEVKGD